MLKFFHATSLVWVLMAAICATAAIDLKSVYAKPQLTLPKVSPDGTKFCVVANNGAVDVITLFDVASFKADTVANLINAELLDYWWKGNDFLVLLVRGTENGYVNFRGLTLSTKKATHIAKINWRSTTVVHPFSDDPDHLLVSTYTGSGWDLRRMNIRDGKSTVIEKNPGNVDRWLIRADGTPLAAVGSEEKFVDGKSHRREFLLWREAKGKSWQRTDLGRQDEPGLNPVAVHPDQNRLIAWDFRPSGTATVVALTPATNATEVLFNSPEVNPDRLTTWGDDNFAAQAIEYETDRPKRFYLTPTARQLHLALDAALPDTVNNILSQSLDQKVMTIVSRSENLPDRFFLLDRRQNRLVPLGEMHGGFSPADTAVGEAFALQARDGLPLTGRIIYPRQANGPVPLIVMTPEWVNGLRTTASFDSFRQALVSNGYAVAQVNWRGTIGFGRAFSEAGDFQHATALPNDLEDATRWLIAQGKIAPRKVALFTRQWGGFPAVHALRANDLFAAWINFNTLLDYRLINAESLAPTLLDERDVIEARGGRKATEAYKRTLDVQPVIDAVRIPQFHHYAYAGAPALEMLRKAQKNTNAPAVFHYFSRTNNAPEVEDQQPLLLAELLSFLRQHVPTNTKR